MPAPRKGQQPNTPDVAKPSYIYPYGQEEQSILAEITIRTDGTVDLQPLETEIPFLKYNKSWLFMLTQDDCKQAAYCCTWAAIHGKPLSRNYYYNAAHLRAGDLPPDTYTLGKSLGSTDGAGNEVRFAFTTTLSPEWSYMNELADVKVGYNKNYYRFFMKSGLLWDDVVEMVNYGTGIAFHNVNTLYEHRSDSIEAHYGLAQALIQKHLSNRGCKVLAEPDGNEAYITAAQTYVPIKIMTLQSGGVTLRPFKVTGDLSQELLNRGFYQPEPLKSRIIQELQLPKEDRAAIHVGVHGTDATWADFLLWLNNTYGQDGDDSMWFPSLEEYYEYNYLRTHATIHRVTEGHTIQLNVELPGNLYSYYPSLTINVKGLDPAHIVSVASGNMVSGLSYGAYEDGVMINIDCRKFLREHAEHFVEQYEQNKTSFNRSDACYFVGMLKDSEQKKALQQRVE